MENPNDLTIETYKKSFKIYKEMTSDEVNEELAKWIDYFTSYLPKNGTILELGSATGKDARYLASKGYKVTCTDVIPEALQKLSQEGFETSEFDFRDEPKEEWKNKFDGFLQMLYCSTPRKIFLRKL